MFTLTRDSSLSPDELWHRVAALADHADSVPLTHTISDSSPPSVGWTFTVRTALGPLRFDDSMVVEEWDAPSQWRIRKTGRLGGWAQAVVSPYAGGSRLTWTEELWVGSGVVRRLTTRIGDLTGPLVFGRVADRLTQVDP